MVQQKTNNATCLSAWLYGLVLLLVAGGPALALADQTAPGNATEPAGETASAPPALTVREIVVLQADRYGDRANDSKFVKSSLFSPIPHGGRNKASAEQGAFKNVPMPLGLISFEGEFIDPMRVRLDLPDRKGYFHAHWPEDAIKGRRTIDWLSVKEADENQKATPKSLGNHWLAGMRSADDRLWLRSRDPLLKERFLLYDASFPFEPTIGLEKTDSGYRLLNQAPESPPQLAMLLRNHHAGWGSATLKPWPTPEQRVISPAQLEATPTPTIKPQLAKLGEALLAMGYSEAETKIALDMVAKAGIKKSGMSLVYVMEQGQISDYIWLRFKPEPDQLIRTAIVVVNNVDPELSTRLDQLIAGLGDDNWAVRDSSQRELQGIGLAAIRKVQALREHKDPEVAFRAQQILDAFDLKQELNR